MTKVRSKGKPQTASRIKRQVRAARTQTRSAKHGRIGVKRIPTEQFRAS